jgi:TrmH family RNA methyltransferase
MLPKHRQRAGRVLVEGLKHIRDAQDAGGRIVALFVSSRVAQDPVVVGLMDVAASDGADVLVCTDGVVSSLSSVEAGQGVVAVFLAPTTGPETVIETMARGAMGIVLDRLQDPGNLGTVLRTASACGACGVILSEGTVDPLNDKVVRSSAAALFSVGVARVGRIGDLITQLKDARIKVVALDARGSHIYFDVPLTGPLALVVGNEGDGVSEEVLGLADLTVSIPMPGRAESLNAAVATSIVAYEAVRQRMRP